MLTRETGEAAVSCCSMNFSDLSEIPASALIDLDLLNRMLVTINRVFVQAFSGNIQWSSDRVSLLDILQAL
jgi:hypothetical protein